MCRGGRRKGVADAIKDYAMISSPAAQARGSEGLGCARGQGEQLCVLVWDCGEWRSMQCIYHTQLVVRLLLT